ncbi:MAG: PIG-L family deacetylase, partial [Desulfovibrio sp.]
MINAFNTILVLAPHTDDGELGCGGTIAKLVEAGKDVYYAAFSTARQSLPSGFKDDTLKHEVKEATLKLGIPEKNLIIFDYEVRKLNYHRQDILEELVQIKRSIAPELIFMPSLNDIHQDHTTIATEALRAYKNNTILGYELIWNNLSFNTQCFIKLEERHIQQKADTLKLYVSQKNKVYTSEEFIF